MSQFVPSLKILTAGQKRVGMSPSKSLSILSVGVVGTLGVFYDDVFYPHPDGAIEAGGMLTFDCGVGREVGINVTSGTGVISSAGV